MDIATYLSSPTQQAVCKVGFFIEDLLKRMVDSGLITQLESYGFSFNLTTRILKAGSKEWTVAEDGSLRRVKEDKR